MRHSEFHRSHRIGWLRAAVLGANDGIVSMASLVIGVASANANHPAVMLSGLAGLVSGAMSMAAGEYVSVSSQTDTEKADLARELMELATDPESELNELTHIYIHRGLSPELARQVAMQLTDHDAYGAHARDELGIHGPAQSRPVQAALSSAVTFAVGAGMPLAVAWQTPEVHIPTMVGSTSLVFLACLGGMSARAGGAPWWKGAWRVTFWGALAMVATALVGRAFGVTVN